MQGDVFVHGVDRCRALPCLPRCFTCRLPSQDHVGKVEKYLKDKEEFDDKGQLHKLSAIELARITEEHPGDKIRSVW